MIAACQTMNLSQYLKNQSIWTEIKAIEPFPFIDDTDNLDLMQNINYGQRILFKAFTDITVAQSAKQIVSLYKDKWNKLIEFGSQSGNIGASASKKVTGTDNKDSVVTNNESAFNSPQLVEDSSVVTKTNGSSDKVEETFSIKTAYENLSYAEKTNILNVVLHDVANYLTLSVY